VALVREHASMNPVTVRARPVPLPSPGEGVDVWLCELARTKTDIEHLATLLSAAEEARAARFGRRDLRDRFVVGRATLRTLLAQRIGIAPSEVVIGRGNRGRPHVVHGRAPGLDFNVSHTRGVALVGMTVGERIGVDIEHGERELNVAGVARKFMSAAEQASLEAMSSDERRRALLRLWTCKEAMSKATGDALSAPFRKLDVVLGAQPRLVDGPAPYSPAHWRLLPVEVPGGYLATVALWHQPDTL
jgi:4'-phosphopantetheinyl transferase